MNILFTLSFTVFINTFCFAQDIPKPIDPIKPKPATNSIFVLSDSIVASPIKPIVVDSTLNDSIKPAKKNEFLSGIVNYKATDYVTLDQRKGQTTLYNEAEVLYEDMSIKAGVIVIDHNKDLVYAGRVKDTSGVYSQNPVFTQGTNVVEPDSIIFNSKTKKAVIFNSKTAQGEGTLIAEKTKKENDSVYFIKNGKFTTAEDLDDPEYYILMRKAKFVPGKKIVTGLANLFFYDVPTPIGVPFAYFPMTNKRKAGILLPSFGEDTGQDRGYFLQNLGYYIPISDYVDLAVYGDYYTNGSYGFRFDNSYAVRYQFRGQFGFRYENLVVSERGFPDYAKSTIYNLRWSHSQDSKANPSSRFSASVNLGSSQYYRQSINQINIANSQNNTLASSVSYSKTFSGEPQVNMSITATHQQNTNTQRINMTLPTFQGSVSRVFPFAPKTGSKKGIIQNINLQYNVRAENRISTVDSLFFKKEMFDDAITGAQHTIPISTNFKVFDYFSVSASTNILESWTLNTINRFYDEETDEVITEDVKGFDRFATYNFSTSVGTTVYGMFDFRKEGREDPKIQRIRHIMRPSITYNINPAFDQYYDTFEVIDADGTTLDEYTRFEGSAFGVPSRNFSSSMGFTLGNNLEAKVRDKDSTATEPKNVILLNNLNLSTSYNFAGDSLQWSPLRMSGGTSIFNNKMSINFGATLDPYALDNNNRKIDKFNIQNGGSLFRLTSANLNMSYTLSSDLFNNKEEDDDGLNEEQERENELSGGRSDDLFGQPQDFADRRLSAKGKDEEKEPNEFYNYSIPWSLRLAYAVNYSNSARQNSISSHALMFSGDIELSPRWTVGVSSGYDFQNKGFTLTQFRFARDLLSWKMDFSWVPFGPQGSWNFFIGIRSSILKDLKYDQRKQRDQRL